MQKTILVTDDQKHMLKVLEFSLADTGCHVETATSGEEAIAKASARVIDLLLIDVKLPGMDGLETVRTLKQNPTYAELPVIVLTGGGREEFNVEAKEVGASLFMTKPFSPIALARQVKQLLSL